MVFAMAFHQLRIYKFRMDMAEMCIRDRAKAINCLNPIDGEPCGTCEICRGIDEGSVTDVVEIDAASNNGVDNIRMLREEAGFTPAMAKYRVYIIDEMCIRDRV